MVGCGAPVDTPVSTKLSFRQQNSSTSQFSSRLSSMESMLKRDTYMINIRQEII